MLVILGRGLFTIRSSVQQDNASNSVEKNINTQVQAPGEKQNEISSNVDFDIIGSITNFNSKVPMLTVNVESITSSKENKNFFFWWLNKPIGILIKDNNLLENQSQFVENKKVEIRGIIESINISKDGSFNGGNFIANEIVIK